MLSGATMKRVFSAACALFILAGVNAAAAADLPVKAPIVKAPIVPLWTWTGFYVGGNVGYSWGSSDVDLRYTDTLGNVFGGSQGTVHPNGVIGGVQAGYNWQFDRWVTGVEVDFQASGEQGSISLFCPAGTCATTAVTTSATEKLKWFGTARGRFGATITPDILLYLTGGLAYGRLTEDGFVTNPTTTIPFSFSKTSLGWAAGAGVEGHLTGRWTWRAEYLFLALREPEGTVVTPIVTVNRIPSTLNVVVDPTFTDHILRVGVNYKWN